MDLAEVPGTRQTKVAIEYLDGIEVGTWWVEFIPEPDEGPDNNSAHPVANPSGGPSLLNTSPRPSLDSDGPAPSNGSEGGARQEGIDGYRTSFVLSSNSSRASAPAFIGVVLFRLPVVGASAMLPDSLISANCC